MVIVREGKMGVSMFGLWAGQPACSPVGLVRTLGSNRSTFVANSFGWS